MDENSAAKKSAYRPPAEFQQYGGQAVIEGVMMRSPRFFAVACRKPNGEIVTQCEDVDKSIMRKFQWLNKPFLRGTLALVDAMALGTRALAFASNVQMEAEQQAAVQTPSDADPAKLSAIKELEEAVSETAASAANGLPIIAPAPKPGKSKINDIAIGGTIAFSFVFGIGLFVLLPTLLTDLGKRLGIGSAAPGGSPLWANVSDGVIRMCIFFAYIGLISFMPQIRRVFQFHGAEHKSINTLEAGLPLTPENALNASRLHPRCGTSFIFIVLVINLIVFAFLPRPAIYLRFPMHLAVIPFVAGLAYEIIKFAGKFRRNPIVNAVFAPGMWSQYLTTREPDREHVEVALASLCAVLRAEGHYISPEGVVAGEKTTNLAEPEAVTA